MYEFYGDNGIINLMINILTFGVLIRCTIELLKGSEFEFFGVGINHAKFQIAVISLLFLVQLKLIGSWYLEALIHKPLNEFTIVAITISTSFVGLIINRIVYIFKNRKTTT